MRDIPLMDQSARGSASAPTEHLSDAELAGFLDGKLAPHERRRVETHLEACSDCRAELVALGRITGPGAAAGNAGASRSRWWIPSAIAAAVVVVLLLPRLTSVAIRPSATERTRIGDGEGTAHFDIVAPADDLTLPASRLTFTWRATNADVYRVTLLTESGDPVWTKDVTDTSIAIPAELTLQPGRSYFWRVDAIAHGIAATTGVHRLQIAR